MENEKKGLEAGLVGLEAWETARDDVPDNYSDDQGAQQDWPPDLERINLLFGVDLSLLSHCHDVPQLPLDMFGPWGPWLETAAADCGAPIEYVAATLLAGASAVIGNARWVAGASNGRFKQPGVLWLVLVGEPSSGKTPAASAVIDALKAIDGEELLAFEPERRKREEEAVIARATEAAWKDQVTAAVRANETPPPMPHDAVVPPPVHPPQILVGDVTGEALLQIVSASPRGVLIYRDELAGLIGGLDRYKSGGSDRAMLNEGYGGGEYRVARKGSGATVVPRLSVSVLGGLQPDRFQSLIAKVDNDGLEARLLFVYPPRKPFSGWPSTRTDEPRLINAFRRLRGLQMADVGDGLKPVIISLDAITSVMFETWYVERGKTENQPVGSQRFLAWWGKGPGRVLRLAMVLELMTWSFDGLGHPPETIGEETLHAAIYLHDQFFAGHARKTFADAALPEAERHAKTIARWLAAQADGRPPLSVTLRELYRNKSLGIADRDQAHAAMQVLCDAGWARAAPSRDGDRPGRRSERYELPDSVWEALAELGGQNR